MQAKKTAKRYSAAEKEEILTFIEKFNAELARILTSADMKEKLLVQGAEARSGSPESFGGFISKEKERWAKVVKGAGIKIE